MLVDDGEEPTDDEVDALIEAMDLDQLHRYDRLIGSELSGPRSSYEHNERLARRLRRIEPVLARRALDDPDEGVREAAARYFEIRERYAAEVRRNLDRLADLMSRARAAGIPTAIQIGDLGRAVDGLHVTFGRHGKSLGDAYYVLGQAIDARKTRPGGGRGRDEEAPRG